MSIDVAPNTIVVYSDLLDPFAHVAVHRLWQARARLGLEGVVRFEHHAFPLELLNGPGTRIGSDSEIPAVGRLEPDAGWQLWSAPDWHYPNTVLLAFEAVQAAAAQSWRLGEELDRALRRAFWAESRPIGHHDVIVELAASIEQLDLARFTRELRGGGHRSKIFDDLDRVRAGAVTMSPHLFLPDGSSVTNPGIRVRWHGEWARGFPVIDHDDPGIVELLVQRAGHDGGSSEGGGTRVIGEPAA